MASCLVILSDDMTSSASSGPCDPCKLMISGLIDNTPWRRPPNCFGCGFGTRRACTKIESILIIGMRWIDRKVTHTTCPLNDAFAEPSVPAQPSFVCRSGATRAFPFVSWSCFESTRDPCLAWISIGKAKASFTRLELQAKVISRRASKFQSHFFELFCSSQASLQAPLRSPLQGPDHKIFFSKKF